MSTKVHCPICSEAMRTDHLVRHMATHKETLVAAMSKKWIDYCKEHRYPVVCNLEAKNVKERYCICLNCKKGAIGFLQRNDPIKFFKEHIKTDCVKHLDKFAKLYDVEPAAATDGSVIEHVAEAPKPALEAPKVNVQRKYVADELGTFTPQFVKEIKDAHGSEDDMTVVKRLQDIVGW